MPAALTSVTYTNSCRSLDRVKGFENRNNARLPIRLRFRASVRRGRPRASAIVTINVQKTLACCAGRLPAAGKMDSKASRKTLGLMGATLLRRGSHPVLHAASLFAALLAVVVLFAGVERVLLGWACAEALFAVYQLRRCARLPLTPLARCSLGSAGAAAARVCHARCQRPADTQWAAAPRYRVLNAEPVEGAAVDPERVALLQERLLQLKGVMSIEKFFSGCVQRLPGSAAGTAVVFEDWRLMELKPQAQKHQARLSFACHGMGSKALAFVGTPPGGSWERRLRA